MTEQPRISIRQGRIIDPASGHDAIGDLHLAGGRIVALGAPPAGFVAEHTLDARGLVVCPGLIDLCARLREPGDEHAATIASETRAAAAGGITTLVCPPDTHPVIDTPAVARLIQQTAERAGLARVLPAGAITQGLDGHIITEMAALRRAGCPVLSEACRPIRDTRVARRALEYAATFDLPVFLHAQDVALAEDGCAHEGAVASRLGLPAVPEAAETVAVARYLALAEQSGARIHFRGLSTARGAGMLAEARERGLAVSADVAMHQLFLTEADIGTFDANCHLKPPVRTAADRDALRRALAAGTIAAISSDHQPHDADAKLAPFPQTLPGLSALDSLLPLMLQLVAEGVLDLMQAIERLTIAPARILGIDAGRLSPGAPADLCVFDPSERWQLDARTMCSRGHNTPFLGRELAGRARWTLLEGRLTHSSSPHKALGRAF